MPCRSGPLFLSDAYEFSLTADTGQKFSLTANAATQFTVRNQDVATDNATLQTPPPTTPPPSLRASSVRVADFLHGLARQLRGPIIVVWDSGTMHKGDPIREALRQLSPRVTLEPLPPYAPMLNPVEHVWAWLKYDRLQNFAPEDAYHLAAVVGAELDAICRDDSFLRRLWQGSDLPIPRSRQP